MTDQLDQATDSELNEAFAMEVANATREYWVEKGGFYYRPPANGYTSNLSEAARYSKEVASKHCAGCRELRIGAFPLPDYSTDANAVLPWLEEWNFEIQKGRIQQYMVYLLDGSTRTGIFGTAPTFARAAVIALIRAHRVTSSETSSTAPTPPPR